VRLENPIAPLIWAVPINRRPSIRGGVFRQKITDGDRILATILCRRRVGVPHNDRAIGGQEPLLPRVAHLRPDATGRQAVPTT
jgi:hypothetical protein